MPGSFPDDQLGELIRLEAAVAIRPAVLRRDDERRIRGDDVEGLTLDRLEQAAEPALDVREAVERRVQLGERERAGIDVRRDDLACLARGEHGLHAAARADVERTLDRPSGSQRVAELGGRRIGGHEVGRVFLGVLAGEIVGGHEQVADRDDAPMEGDLVADGCEARRLERLDGRAAERVRHVVHRHRLLEEQRTEHGAESRVRQPALADRDVVARDPVALFAEEVDHRLLGVADTSQRVAETSRRGSIRYRVPAHRDG